MRIYRNLPQRLINKLESSSRFGGVNFTKTKAISDEMNYAATLRLNMSEEDLKSSLLDSLMADLLDWKVDGERVIKKIYRREDIYWGDALYRSPN